MKTVCISAKSIKSFTKQHLNYELSFNAFQFLDQTIAEMKGENSEEINAWLINILEKAREIGKRVIKRKDIEGLLKEEDSSEISDTIEVEHEANLEKDTCY